MKTKLFLAFGVVLLIGGASLFMLRDRFAMQTAQPVAPPLTTHAAVISGQQVTEGDPVKLSIPSLKLNLSVIPGVYDSRTKTWTLTLDKVQYATMTPLPNDVSGNTFIYGHYRREVFASLHTIQPNAEAMLTTDNGHIFYYKLANIRTTSPEDTSVFNYQGPPILTIQTCTGLFFQNRQLFTFNFERVV